MSGIDSHMGEGIRTVEPGIWRWIFHLFFHINVGGASYCRMTFQQVSRAEESRWELCRVGRERFMMGKWLEIACFRTSVFPIIPVFPRFSRKMNRATFSPESEPYPFSTHIHRRGQQDHI